MKKWRKVMVDIYKYNVRITDVKANFEIDYLVTDNPGPFAVRVIREDFVFTHCNHLDNTKSEVYNGDELVAVVEIIDR
jgi:hypothetical protein